MITYAALKTPDGRIFSLEKPNRHHHIIRMMDEEGVLQDDIHHAEQGFLDEKGTFLNRIEAVTLAIEIGQINIEDLIAPPSLFSEDLW